MAEVHLRVTGGTTFVLRAEPLTALQALAATVEAGPALFRRFLRLAPGRGAQHLTPVAAGGLLQALTLLPNHLEGVLVPGVAFLDNQGKALGCQYSHAPTPLATGNGLRLSADPRGIRIESDELPPPAGFSVGALAAGHYCHFPRLERHGDAWLGARLDPPGTTELPHLPLPPVARWDSLSSSDPTPAVLLHRLAPARDVYRDHLAILTAAFTEALRLLAPLTVQRA